MSTTDELADANTSYAEQFDQANLPMPPSRKVTVVACMDARLDVYRLLGLRLGEAHVIRNAGGVVTEDVIRSLVISQRLLGTEEIVLIHHSDCGMLTFHDDDVKAQILADTGLRPPFALEAFDDPAQDVSQSLARIDANPFLRSKSARGFVYDINTGKLNEIAR